MESVVALRDLKQNPSAVVARVEAGETIAVTVRGRHAATLIPPKIEQKRATAADLATDYDRIERLGDAALTQSYLDELDQVRHGFDDEPWEKNE